MTGLIHTIPQQTCHELAESLGVSTTAAVDRANATATAGASEVPAPTPGDESEAEPAPEGDLGTLEQADAVAQHLVRPTPSAASILAFPLAAAEAQEERVRRFNVPVGRCLG